MQRPIIEIGPFSVIGISVITTNTNAQSAQDLGALWQRFYVEQLMDKVPQTLSNEVYAVYTDYESDFTGKYTAIIGLRSNASTPPHGLTMKKFTGGKFVRYVAKGQMPTAVINTWQQIWADDKQLNRRYEYDFEVYGAKSNDGENAEVDIYISVK